MQKHLHMKRRGKADCSDYPSHFTHLEERRKRDINLGALK